MGYLCSHVIESTWNRGCSCCAASVSCRRLCVYDVYALCATLPWWQSNITQQLDSFKLILNGPLLGSACCSAYRATVIVLLALERKKHCLRVVVLILKAVTVIGSNLLQFYLFILAWQQACSTLLVEALNLLRLPLGIRFPRKTPQKR